jgi:3-hydroxyisobutyrate dehydrogenase
LIAYFGTGLLGSGFVSKLLERGESVNVWNRTTAKAQPLAAEGATIFTSTADAVKGVGRLHLTLSDDAAVDSVLEPLADVIDKTTIVFDHTTTAPTPTAERIRRWTERGITFVHAPVFMGPKNSREATGIMLLSGAPELRARVLPMLAPMTGKVMELGDDPARASAFKLFGNMLLINIVGGLSDVFTLARAVGVEPLDALALFEEFNPASAIQPRGKSMAGGNPSVSFELPMARKDLRLMIEEAARHNATLPITEGTAALMERYLAAGFKDSDMAIIGTGKA